jgi:hypothetical protein
MADGQRLRVEEQQVPGVPPLQRLLEREGLAVLVEKLEVRGLVAGREHAFDNRRARRPGASAGQPEPAGAHKAARSRVTVSGPLGTTPTTKLADSAAGGSAKRWRMPVRKREGWASE